MAEVTSSEVDKACRVYVARYRWALVAHGQVMARARLPEQLEELRAALECGEVVPCSSL